MESITNSSGRYKNPNTISTGNKFIDKNLAKYGAKAVGTVVKIPKGKIVVKAAEKAYPYIEKGSANIARAKLHI